MLKSLLRYDSNTSQVNLLLQNTSQYQHTLKHITKIKHASKHATLKVISIHYHHQTANQLFVNITFKS
jgi:hypothetical protein